LTFLIVGLGNPGREYYKTRHNVGFLVIDQLAQELDISLQIGPGDYLLGQGFFFDHRVFLSKPLTYMNRSGQAVGQLLRKCEVALGNLLVVLDDFNLPTGTLRIRQRGSDGGHKGLASIIKSLGTEDFPRLRIGIGNYRDQGIDPVTYVLSEFSTSEWEIIQRTVQEACQAIRCYMEQGIDQAMSLYNKVMGA